VSTVNISRNKLFYYKITFVRYGL